MTRKADDTELPGGENVLIWPSGWQRLVIPRRRERPGPPPAVAANVVAAYENAKPADAAKVTQALTAPGADAALAAVYRAEADLPLADVTPTGAALVAALRWASGPRKPAEARTTVDAWVTARGLEFAVRAALERCDLMAQESKHTACSLKRAPAWLMWGGEKPRPAMLARLRQHLAAADDDTYADIVTLLGDYPFTGDRQYLAAAFLVPDQRHWVTAAIDQMQGRPNTSPLAFGAVSTVEQADALFLALPWAGAADTETLATLVDGLGSDAQPYLLRHVDSGLARSEEVERIFTAVSAFPTDEALRALIGRVGHPKAAAAILAAADRYPRRGVRLLAASPSDRVRPLLRAHVLSHREIAAAELKHLDGVAFERVRKLLDDDPHAADAADAAADGVPATLLTPPWIDQKRKTKPTTTTGLAAPRESDMVWLPAWTAPDLLPPVLLTGRASALPADAVRNLCLLLAIAKPGTPFPALDEVRSACDQQSLTEFVWALFQNWRTAGMPASEAWTLEALGRLGDDAIVPGLAALIRAWPGENAHHRAVQGLDVLGAIGSDAALGQLYAISQRIKFKALKERAAQRIRTIATALGLTADQLGDRLVPDLGLDASGTVQLSFGPRAFMVGLDEHLRPLVLTEDGKRLKDLPKPGADDDAATADQSRAQYAQLKKDARALASEQVHRLEKALLVGRRWSAPEFRTYVVNHPVMRNIARRLVWSAYSTDGTAPLCFRIAEDLTFADADDAVFVLEDHARVGVAHPLEFGEAAAKWSELFADYELLQPFQQLGRAVCALTEEEKSALTLDRFTGKSVPPGRSSGWSAPAGGAVIRATTACRPGCPDRCPAAGASRSGSNRASAWDRSPTAANRPSRRSGSRHCRRSRSGRRRRAGCRWARSTPSARRNCCVIWRR